MSFNIDKITSGVTDYVKGAAGKIGNVLDPSGARLAVAGLLQGGRKKSEKPVATRIGFSVGSPDGQAIPIEQDWRVRVGVAPGSGIFYDSGDAGIMAPLIGTQGVVFPYTPSITTSYTATYGSTKTTHSNYPAYFYDSSEVQAIQLSGDFTVQSAQEGQYLLACIYFFRSATKMFYGAGTNGGNPPPVVFLNGYGSELFPNVPCVVTSFQHTMGADVDYLEIPTVVENPAQLSIDSQNRALANAGYTDGGKGPTTRVPTASQLQISLQPIYSRATIAQFDLDEFARGNLLGKGFI